MYGWRRGLKVRTLVRTQVTDWLAELHAMELKALLSPRPSAAIVKFWQGIVEIVLRSLCILLVVLALIGAIAAVRDLGEPDTPVPSIEALRYNTRSPSGWILVVILLAMPLEILMLIIRFMNIPIVNRYPFVVLTIDACVSFMIAAFFFGGAVALGIHATDWASWRSSGSDMENTLYGLYRIVPSVGAEAAFSFFASFGFIALGVWMILFVILRWNWNLAKYIVDPKTIETTGKSEDPEADTQPVATEEEVDEVVQGGQLEFSEK